MYGYDKIEPTLERAEPTIGRKTFEQKACDEIAAVMSMYGVYGAMTYSFESPKVFDKLCIKEDSKLRDVMKITNPLGEDFSIMRTTTLNGILTSLSTNFNRRNAEAALYEIGKIYIKPEVVAAPSTDPKLLGENELPQEIKKLTIGQYGKNVDFFTMKGMVETLMEALHVEKFEFTRNSELEYMHPGRTANLIVNGKEAGFFGAIHPQVAKNYEIDTDVYMAELDLAAILAGVNQAVSFKPLPKYPATTRDIAMLVTSETLVGDLEKVIKQRGGKILESVELFDVYQGEQIEKGMKSVAYKLIFRDANRTLEDEDVQKVMKKILNGLEMNCGAKLRD